MKEENSMAGRRQYENENVNRTYEDKMTWL